MTLVVATTIAEAVNNSCDTVTAAREKGLAVPIGGCSCPAHTMLTEKRTEHRMDFARFRSAQMQTEEFNVDVD